MFITLCHSCVPFDLGLNNTVDFYGVVLSVFATIPSNVCCYNCILSATFKK